MTSHELAKKLLALRDSPLEISFNMPEGFNTGVSSNEWLTVSDGVGCYAPHLSWDKIDVKYYSGDPEGDQDEDEDIFVHPGSSIFIRVGSEDNGERIGK